MDTTFWKYMVATGGNAYSTWQLFQSHQNGGMVYRDEEYVDIGEPEGLLYPVWCFHWFGHTITILPGGHRFYIGGGHEDANDADFATHNDVVVVNRPSPSFRAQDLDEIDSDSSAVRESLYHDIVLRLSKPEDITIYGYPLDVFPSTDFHKATYSRVQPVAEPDRRLSF